MAVGKKEIPGRRIETVEDARELIRSTKATDKTDGFAWLKRYFEQHRDDPALGSLGQNAIRVLYDDLFQVISDEKKSFSREASKITKASAAVRLGQGAAALRAVIAATVGSLTRKQAGAVVSHVLQILPYKDGGYLVPVELDYLKILRTILEYQAHVEHFAKTAKKDQWRDVLDFCLEGLESERDSNSIPASGDRHRRGAISPIGIELLGSLKALTSASNAPLLQFGPEILNVVLPLLVDVTAQSNVSISEGFGSALAVLQSTFSCLALSQSSVVHSVLPDVLTILARLLTTANKIQAVREEVLAVLLVLKPQLASLAFRSTRSSIATQISSLASTLLDDYINDVPSNKQRLDLESIDLTLQHRHSLHLMPMQQPTFSVRISNQEVESHWTQLHLTAFLQSWLDVDNDASQISDSSQAEAGTMTTNDDVDDRSKRRAAKRRRVSTNLETLLTRIQDAKSVTQGVRILQIVCFSLATRILSVNDLCSVISQMLELAAAKDSQLASWALICLSCCTVQDNSKHDLLHKLWLVSAQLAMQKISSLSYCRAACHTMSCLLTAELIDYKEIDKAIDAAVLSAALNGPALLCESALELWLHMVSLEVQHHPGVSANTGYENMLEWIINKWGSSDPNHNRSHGISNTLELDAKVVYTLRALLSAENQPIERACFPSMGRLGQVWLEMQDLHKASEFLYMLQDCPLVKWKCHKATPPKTSGIRVLTRNRLLSRLLLYLESHLEMLQNSWSRTNEISLPSQRNDAMLTIFSSGAAAMALKTELEDVEDERVKRWYHGVSELVHAVFNDARDAQIAQSVRQGIVNATVALLPSPKHIACSQGVLHELGCLGGLLVAFSSNLTSFKSPSLQPESASAGDFIDDIFEDTSQRSRAEGSESEPVPRLHYQALTCTSSAYMSSLHYLFLCNLYKSTNVLPDTHLPTGLVTCLNGFSPEELIFITPLMTQILDAGLAFQAYDAEILINRIAHNFMMEMDETSQTSTGGRSQTGRNSIYNWERCESAISLSLKIMHGTADSWVEPGSDTLGSISEAIYAWLYDLTSRESEVSNTMKISFAGLLHRMQVLTSEYPRDMPDMPSMRTILFNLLGDADVTVKFAVGQNLSGVFAGFATSQHEAILDDINDKIPPDHLWAESLSIRLFVFMTLGAAWKSLLRRCFYYIVETAGIHADTLPQARYCLQSLCSQLSIPRPRDLLYLLKSHLLYNWLDQKEVDAVPYAIFGYATLKDLLTDLQTDIVSILFLQVSGVNPTHKLDSYLALVDSTLPQALETCFARVAAYALEIDASSKAPDGSPSKEAETRLQTLLPNYLNLLISHRHRVLGTVLLRTDTEVDITRHFERTLQYALKALNDMKSMSCSLEVLPAPQRPYFTARALPNVLLRFSRRLELPSGDDLWTADQLMISTRLLLNDFNLALGEAHAIGVVRRIRLLVAISGSRMLTGYPLEQMLHGLRPMISCNGTNDDAIGVLQYLLENGRSYLQTRPAFMAGFLVALFLELLAKSTSQEPDTANRPQTARTLHQWLARYLDIFKPSGLKDETHVRFQAIMDSVRRMNKLPNAKAGTAESDLLMALMEEGSNGSTLMGRRAQSTAYKLFCKLFQTPVNFREDVLGTDRSSTASSARLWKVTQFADKHDDFLIWSAKVLGRSFAGTGSVPTDMIEESDLTRLKGVVNMTAGPLRSKIAILLSVIDLVHSDKSIVGGRTEAALQKCMRSYSDVKELAVIAKCLPRGLREALCSPQSEEASDSEHVPSLVTMEGSQITHDVRNIPAVFDSATELDVDSWQRGLVKILAASIQNEPIVAMLTDLLGSSRRLAGRVFPFVLHLAVQHSMETTSEIRDQLSLLVSRCAQVHSKVPMEHLGALLNAILYLRTQPQTEEDNVFDRNYWLELDYGALVPAAIRCNMHKTALLFVEIERTIQSLLKKPSSGVEARSDDVLLAVFPAMDEPDAFYGVHQADNLSAVGDRLAYEGNTMQSLLFRGAQLDSESRGLSSARGDLRSKLISSMGAANLNTIVQDLIASGGSDATDALVTRNMTTAAMNLNRWDVPIAADIQDSSSIVYRTLQTISTSQKLDDAQIAVRLGLLDIGSSLRRTTTLGSSISAALVSLASLAEIDQLLSSQGPQQLKEILKNMKTRELWMTTGRAADVAVMLKVRKAIIRVLLQNRSLQQELKFDRVKLQLAELDILIRSSSISRKLGSLEDSLADVTFLSGLADQYAAEGLKVTGAVSFEISNTLFDRGELVPSINILRKIERTCAYDEQQLTTSRAEVVATLGHRLSVTRLEKPADIVSNYLEQALHDLDRSHFQAQAGTALHIYATFCHDQVSGPEVLEEIRRSEVFRAAKQAEVRELEIAARGGHSSTLVRARNWLKIDSEELSRLKHERETYIKKSLNCYLDCLAISDEYDTDAIRFTALWLEHSENENATNEVKDRMDQVPSRKFAILMNQLVSRLQRGDEVFQQVLKRLIEKICTDHPYHGMNHVYASWKTSGGKDIQAQARQAAAAEVVTRLTKSPKTSDLWVKLDRANNSYSRFAKVKDGKEKFKENTKMLLTSLDDSSWMQRDVPRLRLPPITMTVDLRADMDYTNVPIIAQYEPEMTILGGLSAPKLITERLSNGRMHKELFKSGADDMRQDSIMEQVFAEVSSLLQKNKATQQRQLRIRTYNVVPLDGTSGAIEFVQNTTPLMSFLEPAHTKYHPDEWRWQTVRSKWHKLVDAKAGPKDRMRLWQDVIKRFTPVMRHFFFERFDEPDIWFERRLAYTRSTAANSILGHIVGLGDRHNQNILLDARSGEMIHIDLGVAFDSGRVLPMPELVPFRLTRDIVDGFGVLGTEGVFRRCCEFTLEALRENKDTIMTLLNVLRYDPLHNWTLSPLRARRLQKEQDTAGSTPVATPLPTRTSTRRSLGGAGIGPVGGVGAGQSNVAGVDMGSDEGGEADRALSVVEKKLGKQLSVQAAVNELIQQATDGANLALLFTGWAAWA